MKHREIEPVPDIIEDTASIESELEGARRALLEAEAELAKEQAEVNAFRMHCRLKLDRWIERLLELQTEKQSLLTRLELLRQAEDLGIPFDDEEAFWRGDEDEPVNIGEEELILPTDVPRDKEAEKILYRRLARKFHPDLGNTALEIAYRTEMMTAVNKANANNDVQALYDLADQLGPKEVADLATITSLGDRKLQGQLIRLRQRRRKAQRRLENLRLENTTRLWRKARRLEQDDTHWWEVVRRELEREIERLSHEVDIIKAQVTRLETTQEEFAGDG
jgi:hypothetical protein